MPNSDTGRTVIGTVNIVPVVLLLALLLAAGWSTFQQHSLASSQSEPGQTHEGTYPLSRLAM